MINIRVCVGHDVRNGVDYHVQRCPQVNEYLLQDGKWFKVTAIITDPSTDKVFLTVVAVAR